MERPITTLFMLESLDGKINSGNNDELDADRDWCKIVGVKEGLQQYYDIETTTDFYSLNKPHLNIDGINYLCNWVEKLILVTTNKNHIAFSLKEKYKNLDIIFYNNLDLNKLLLDVKEKYKVDKITIQSGGNLNSLFLRENLIDYVNIVIAPLLVGGRDTSTLIDGEAISKVEDLNKLKALKLLECNKLNNSYVQLIYKVIK